MLVELYNRDIFQAGLVIVGTLAYMGWLNEYGAIAVAARTDYLLLALHPQARDALESLQG